MIVMNLLNFGLKIRVNLVEISSVVKNLPPKGRPPKKKISFAVHQIPTFFAAHRQANSLMIEAGQRAVSHEYQLSIALNQPCENMSLS